MSLDPDVIANGISVFADIQWMGVMQVLIRAVIANRSRLLQPFASFLHLPCIFLAFSLHLPCIFLASSLHLL